jgi:hypothetical protein
MWTDDPLVGSIKKIIFLKEKSNSHNTTVHVPPKTSGELHAKNFDEQHTRASGELRRRHGLQRPERGGSGGFSNAAAGVAPAAPPAQERGQQL